MKKYFFCLLLGVALCGCKNEYTESLKRDIWKIDREITNLREWHTYYTHKVDSLAPFAGTDMDATIERDVCRERADKMLRDINDKYDQRKELQREVDKNTRFFDRSYDYDKIWKEECKKAGIAED